MTHAFPALLFRCAEFNLIQMSGRPQRKAAQRARAVLEAQPEEEEEDIDEKANDQPRKQSRGRGVKRPRPEEHEEDAGAGEDDNGWDFADSASMSVLERSIMTAMEAEFGDAEKWTEVRHAKGEMDEAAVRLAEVRKLYEGEALAGNEEAKNELAYAAGALDEAKEKHRRCLEDAERVLVRDLHNMVKKVQLIRDGGGNDDEEPDSHAKGTCFSLGIAMCVLRVPSTMSSLCVPFRSRGCRKYRFAPSQVLELRVYGRA